MQPLFKSPEAHLNRLLTHLFNIELEEHELVRLLEDTSCAKCVVLKKLNRLNIEDEEVLTRRFDYWETVGNNLLSSLQESGEVSLNERLLMFIVEEQLYHFILEHLPNHQGFFECIEFVSSTGNPFKHIFGELNRNDLCFCESGKKFKKCCSYYFIPESKSN